MATKLTLAFPNYAELLARRKALAAWDTVRESWAKAQRLGWDAVREAARVGAMLIELKAETEHGKFKNLACEIFGSYPTAARVMLLARNLPLLEKHKPDSQRAALALIPKAKKSEGKGQAEENHIGVRRRGIRKNRDAPYDPATPGQKTLANAQKKKLVNALSHVNGICIGLEEFDVEMARSVCTIEEIKQWAAVARTAVSAFRMLARKLKRADDRDMKREYNVSTACGMPTGMQLWMSDAEIEGSDKEFKRRERKNAKATERRRQAAGRK